MTRDVFFRILQAAERHKTSLNVCVACTVVLLSCVLFLIPLDFSLTMMLPTRSESVEMIRVFEKTDLAGKVALSITPEDESISRVDFISRVSAFAAALQPPLITQTISRITDAEMIEGLQFFLEQTPALLTDNDWHDIEDKTTPDGVEALLRSRFSQLMKPEGSYLAELIRRDPLDLQSRMIKRIQQLSTSFGYEMRMEDQHIFSADGNHLLMILETPVPFTDSKGSQALIDYIRDQQGQFLGSGIRLDIICGHMHSLSNEKVIRADIQRTMTIAGLAFALLFLLWFKDIRAVFVFLIPFAGLLVGIPAAAVLTGALSPMILGFGCVIAGISVDYGIHTYIAIRRGTSPADAVLAIARPMTISALTTSAVFVAFFFTRIEGYHQLAVLALVSLFFSLGAALILMPLVILPNTTHPRSIGLRTANGLPSKWIVVGFLLAFSISIPFAIHVPFDSDMAKLDGSEPSVFEAEMRFRRIWGGGEQDLAILAVSGSDYDTAFEQGYQVYQKAAARIGTDPISSFYSVWKPASQRNENRLRWNAFWNTPRRAEFKQLLREKGAAYGFSEDAFLPFFTSLENTPIASGKPTDNLLFDQLQSRFIQQRNGSVTVLMFVPDTEEYYAALSPLNTPNEGIRLLSRRVLSRNLSMDFRREIVRIVAIAAVLMVLAVFLLIKRSRLAFIAMTPAVVAIPILLASLTIMQVPLNIVSLIAAVVVSGLCIDYGIFYTYVHAYRLDTGTPVAVALSAGTTIVGAGALLFAKHPALFPIGLTLVCGVCAGYLTARLLIPALCQLCPVEELS